MKGVKGWDTANLTNKINVFGTQNRTEVQSNKSSRNSGPAKLCVWNKQWAPRTSKRLSLIRGTEMPRREVAGGCSLPHGRDSMAGEQHPSTTCLFNYKLQPYTTWFRLESPVFRGHRKKTQTRSLHYMPTSPATSVTRKGTKTSLHQEASSFALDIGWLAVL